MKIIINTTALFLCFNFLQAQHLNLHWQPDFFSYPEKIIAYQGDWLVAGRIHDRENEPTGYAFARIGAQQIEWEVIGPGENPFWDRACGINEETGQIVFFNRTGSCDVSPGSFWGMMDSEGDFSIAISGEGNTLPAGAMDVLVFDNGGFATAGYGGIRKFTSSFSNTFNFYTTYPELGKQLAASSDTLYWAGIGTYDSLYKVKPFYSSGHQQDFPTLVPEEGELILDIGADEGSVFFCTKEAFYRYHYSNEALERKPFLSGTIFSKVESNGSTYFLLGEDGSGNTHLRRLNEGLHFIDDSIIDWDAIPIDLAIQNDTIALLGQYELDTGVYYGDPEEVPFILGDACSMIAIKTIELDNDPTPPQTDLSLNGIAWNGELEILPTLCYMECSDQMVHVDIDRISLTIQNNGFVPVDGFSIATRKNFCRGCLSFCQKELGFWQHYNHILLPGQIITVPFKEEMIFRNQALANEFELCFWVTPGNAQADIDYTDNILCENLVINPSSESNKNEVFSYYPNPVDDFLFLNFDNVSFKSDHEIVIYNSQGAVVKKVLLSKETLSYKINMQKLSAGVYWLVWENGERELTRKIIKQ